jgi:acetyl-CoA acyltransferase 1
MLTLAKLKPVFTATVALTAGNSSQISDGGAAALMMRTSTAESLGLKEHTIGKWDGTKVVGVKPDELNIGPVIALRMILKLTGLSVAEIDIWEINEALASQAIFCTMELGIDMEKVNPKGGAIALGHPLGATGARQLATTFLGTERQGQEVGIISYVRRHWYENELSHC